MIYRDATLDDIKDIIEIKNRVKNRIIKENLPIWLNGYPLDDFIIEDIKNSHGRVVEIDGKIAAYCAFHPSNIDYEEYIENTENHYSFGRVMVDDYYLGKGVGRFLINNVINEAKSLNQKGMIISADECNIKAVNLYQSFGFKKIKEIEFPYAYLTVYRLEF